MIDRVGGGFKDYSPLILRLGLATIFILQGGHMVSRMPESPPVGKIIELVVELLGGLFCLIGFMTRWSAFALGVLELWVMVNDRQFHHLTVTEYQLPFACLMMCGALYGLGGGRYSIDEKQKKKKDD